MIEEIFAGEERTLGMAPRIKFEREGAANDSFVLEEVRDGALRGAVRNFHEDAFGRNGSVRLFDGKPEIARHGSGAEQDDENEW